MRSWLDSLRIKQIVYQSREQNKDFCHSLHFKSNSQVISVCPWQGTKWSRLTSMTLFYMPPVPTYTINLISFLILFLHYSKLWLDFTCSQTWKHTHSSAHLSELEMIRITKVGIIRNVKGLIYKFLTGSCDEVHRHKKLHKTPLNVCIYIPESTWVWLDNQRD